MVLDSLFVRRFFSSVSALSLVLVLGCGDGRPEPDPEAPPMDGVDLTTGESPDGADLNDGTSLTN